MDQGRESDNQKSRDYARNTVLIGILVSLMPMLLISGLVLDQFSTSYNEKLYAQLGEAVHRHAQEIDVFLMERLNNLQFLLDSCDSENLINESILQDRLFQLQQKYNGVFEDLGVINAAGVQEAYAGRYKLENAEYSDAGWFKEALKRPYYISDVFLGLRSRPHFIVCVKRTDQGRTYLLRSTINFEAFNSLAENLHFGKTGFAFILNRKGDFQTKSHFSMMPYDKSYIDVVTTGKKIKHDIYIGEISDAFGWEHAIYLASLLKDKNWVLVYLQEKNEAFSDLIRTKVVAIVILSIGALLIVVMNSILFHKVIRHLSKVDQEKKIMNRQIIETGKLASVGRLAAGTAHEINNPVAIMVQEAGWAGDLLKQEEFQNSKNLQEIKRALEQIDLQGKRCKEITHKLLRFASKTDMRMQNVQLNEIIKEVVEISNKTSYTGISIHTHLDKTLPPISGSPTEIQQILLNLINNARYALEKNGGRITISTRLEDLHVLVVVKDNGPGIPKANLDRIFDPFFTTKPVGKGNGLGLSICFGIVKRMGGEISVSSTIDKETRFEIRFLQKIPNSLKTKDTSV